MINAPVEVKRLFNVSGCVGGSVLDNSVIPPNDVKPSTMPNMCGSVRR